MVQVVARPQAAPGPDLAEGQRLLGLGPQRPARGAVGDAQVKVAVDVVGVEKVEELFLVGRVLDEPEALLVGKPHDALDSCRGVVSHL